MTIICITYVCILNNVKKDVLILRMGPKLVLYEIKPPLTFVIRWKIAKSTLRICIGPCLKDYLEIAILKLKNDWP